MPPFERDTGVSPGGGSGQRDLFGHKYDCKKDKYINMINIWINILIIIKVGELVPFVSSKLIKKSDQ